MKNLRLLMVLLGAAAITFFGIGLLKPVVTYRTELYIDVPVDRVFAAYADLPQQARWMPGRPEVVRLSPGDSLTGLTVRLSRTQGGRTISTTQTLVAAAPDTLLQLQVESPAGQEERSWRFVPDGDGTTLYLTGRLRGRTYLHRCLYAFTRYRLRGQARRELYGFKFYAEETWPTPLEPKPIAPAGPDEEDAREVLDAIFDSETPDSLLETMMLDLEAAEKLLLEEASELEGWE